MNTDSLTKDFPSEIVKVRPFDKLKYVEAGHYINRLNLAFDHQWSLEVIEHSRIDKYILVRVRVSAENTIKESFGGHMITKDIGDAYKAAVTDAMKKCAWMMGVGVGNWIEREERALPLLDELKKTAIKHGFKPHSIVPAIRNRFGKAPQELTKDECMEAISMMKEKLRSKSNNE